MPFNSALSLAMLTALMLVAWNQNNKTATLSAVLVIGIHLLSRLPPRLYAYVAALVAFGLLFHYDLLINTIQYNLNGRVGLVQTNLERTLDIEPVIRGYLDADIFSYAFGSYLMGPQAVLKVGKAPFAGELRGLAMPLSYGLGWALIVGSGLVTMLWYAYRVINTKSTKSEFFEVFGLAFLGLLIVYISDLHYPKWNTHGALELFLVAAVTLSSLREVARTQMSPSKEMLGNRG